MRKNGLKDAAGRAEWIVVGKLEDETEGPLFPNTVLRTWNVTLPPSHVHRSILVGFWFGDEALIRLQEGDLCATGDALRLVS